MSSKKLDRDIRMIRPPSERSLRKSRPPDQELRRTLNDERLDSRTPTETNFVESLEALAFLGGLLRARRNASRGRTRPPKNSRATPWSEAAVRQRHPAGSVSPLRRHQGGGYVRRMIASPRKCGSDVSLLCRNSAFGSGRAWRSCLEPHPRSRKPAVIPRSTLGIPSDPVLCSVSAGAIAPVSTQRHQLISVGCLRVSAISSRPGCSCRSSRRGGSSGR